jgi:hypothetical protein
MELSATAKWELSWARSIDRIPLEASGKYRLPGFLRKQTDGLRKKSENPIED